MEIAIEAIFIAETGRGYDGLPAIDQDSIVFEAVKQAVAMASSVRGIGASMKSLGI